jgi:hypothetical protein
VNPEESMEEYESDTCRVVGFRNSETGELRIVYLVCTLPTVSCEPDASLP